MAVYLVDFENVRSEGLKGVEDLGKDDKVVIFYSKNADAITFDVHLLLSKSNAEIETYRILRGGHNSLDFQLSTYLGYLVMENCYNRIVIVSKDKGFLFVTGFWEENGDKCNAKIMLCKSIKAAEFDDELDQELDDGLSGKIIEKLDAKDGIFGKKAAREASGNGDESLNEENCEKDAKDDSESVTGIEFKTQGNGRNYSRPPGPKRTTYYTNIYTKAEPYYRKPAEGSYMQRKPRNGNDYNKKPSKMGNRIQPAVPENFKADNTKNVATNSYLNNRVNGMDINSDKSFEKPFKKESSPVDIKAIEKINVKPDTIKDIEKVRVKQEIKKELPVNPQNPTRKNKIFAAEVKFNIKDDVKDLIKDKYDDSYIPMLLEYIGMSTGKQNFYRMLVNKVGQKDGLELYKLIKGQYANLKRK